MTPPILVEFLDPLTVKNLLEHAYKFPWSLQGLGMLRLSLTPNMRIHVWSHEFKVPGVTPIHDHPWNLDSVIYSGKLVNRLFTPVDCDSDPEFIAKAKPYEEQRIVCGPGGCSLSEPRLVRLAVTQEQTYVKGSTYHQYYYEIHESLPEDGTVTVIQKWTPEHVNKDQANVYIEWGKQWVSAEPREATEQEIRRITRRALERWS